MRLAAIRRGNRWPNRLFLRLAGKLSKMDPPDVVRTMNYRSGFFGGPYSAVLQSVMRGGRHGRSASVSCWPPTPRT
jgi:hypothetical protein